MHPCRSYARPAGIVYGLVLFGTNAIHSTGICAHTEIARPACLVHCSLHLDSRNTLTCLVENASRPSRSRDLGQLQYAADLVQDSRALLRLDYPSSSSSCRRSSSLTASGDACSFPNIVHRYCFSLGPRRHLPCKITFYPDHPARLCLALRRLSTHWLCVRNCRQTSLPDALP